METADASVAPRTTLRYASRKLGLSVAAFTTFTALLVFGKIDQGAYVTLAVFALGGYLGANVIQKATAKKASDA